MNKIKEGDIVGRKSYGKDIIFTVAKIIYKDRKEIAILNGVIERITADSELSDLELIEKNKIKEVLRNLNNKVEKRIEESKERNPREILIFFYYSTIEYITYLPTERRLELIKSVHFSEEVILDRVPAKLDVFRLK